MIKTKKAHEVVRVTDSATGRPIVRIRLGKACVWVEMEEKDYLRFVADHGERPLFFNAAGHGRQYVRFSDGERGNLGMLARFVSNDPPGKRVQYNDGNPLNLRRSNLTPTTGRFAGTRKRPSKRPSAPDEFATAPGL